MSMKIRIMYIFATLTLLLSACSPKGSVHEVKTAIAYDTIAVDIDYPILSNYVSLEPFFLNDKKYVMGYNHFAHSFDFINLYGGEHFSLELQKEGPDAVLKEARFCQLEDHLLCLDSSGLSVLTMGGKVIKKIALKELLSPEGDYLLRPKGVSLGNYISINSYANECFIPLFPNKGDSDVRIGKVYDRKTQSLTSLPMTFPENIRKDIKVSGGLSMPQIVAYKDVILFNFPKSSVVYQYDRNKGTVRNFDIRSCSVLSDWDEDKNDEDDVKGKFMNELLCSRFGKVYYSADLDLYFRVHFGARESLKDKERDIYLMTYDIKTNKIGEYLLPPSFSEQYVVMNDTIYFCCKNSDDSKLYFARINVGKL